MATFRFTAGPWNIHEGNETFGPGHRKSIPLEEKMKKYAEIGLAGMQFHDDDAVPDMNNMTEKQIIDYAKVPTQRSSPSYSRSAVLGALLGGVLAIIYVTLRSLLDVRIKDEDDINVLFDYPVLGQIPHFDQPSSGKKNAYAEPYAANSGRGK